MQDFGEFRLKSCRKMIGKSVDQNQKNLFHPLLQKFINPDHPLVILGEKLVRYTTDIELFKQVISQHRYSKNKVYSLHEPHTSCIAKGKAHKEYEFGCKTFFAMLPKSNIIVGVQTFKGNPHDSKTLEPTLSQCKRVTNLTFKRVILDRGYKGITHVGNIIALISGKIKAKTVWQKQWYRKKFRSRSAIGPIIGHLKTDCRLLRNYLKGTQGDQINAFMAAAALKIEVDFG